MFWHNNINFLINLSADLANLRLQFTVRNKNLDWYYSKINDQKIHSRSVKCELTIRTSSPFHAAVIVCFWYFDNNVLSLITFDINKVNVSSISFSTLHKCVLCAIFFFLWKPKVDSNIKIFIENQLPVKTNQIYGLMTVPLKKSDILDLLYLT